MLTRFHGFAALIGLIVTIALCTESAKSGQRSLGKVEFDVSCSDEAQARFNHAMALLHHMTYPQARIAFAAITRDEPACAMAYWGQAMSLYHPLWPDRPTPEALETGCGLVEKAQALEPGTELESLHISAAEAFFCAPAGTDYWERVQRWADATHAAYQAFPRDHDTAALQALALLATAPAADASQAQQARAAALLTEILDQNPAHPGAAHYLIHADDAPGRAALHPENVADYAQIAPNNPHALHMPTHIGTRLGDWDKVIAGNLAAAEAALAHPAGDQGQWVWDEFPHAIEYLVYAYLQRGDDAAARAQAERLRGTRNLHPTFKTAFHLSSIPARYSLERQAWTEAAALEPRPMAGLDWEHFPWAEAVTWFAKGVGAARSGDIEPASEALRRLITLREVADEAGETLFERQIRVLELAVAAWIAEARRDHDEAERLMAEAAELEAATPKHPVTPGPTLPASEQLGDLLLKRDPDRALQAYEDSLATYPGRFNSLLGAARAAEAADRAAIAGEYFERLVNQAVPTSQREGLQEAREAAAP